MRIKRALLISWACIEALLICLYLRGVVLLETPNPEPDLGYYASLISYVSNIASIIRTICLIAVVDFLFYVGRKTYNRSMFAIALTMFVFAVLLLTEIPSLVSFKLPSFFQVIEKDVYTGMAYFYLWTALTTLTLVGLAIAYVAVKFKYLKKLK